MEPINTEPGIVPAPVPVIDAEIVPAVPVGLDPVTKRFVAGNKLAGSRRNVQNKLTKLMFDELDKALEAGGERANPMLCLVRLMSESESEAIQLSAARALLEYVIPKRHSVELETVSSEEMEQRTQEVVQVIRTFYSRREAA